MSLHDLDVAVLASGLRVVLLPGWKERGRPGSFAPHGVLVHHTGSTSNERSYVEWMAYTGRSDLPAPLCQLALDRQGTVYVLAAGRANHGGKARATGPMPAGDANTMYIGIEALNSGSEGWTRAQRGAYVRLCAALCAYYGWPASHVRGHRETSLTGKWDPGGLDLDGFRRDIAATIPTIGTEGDDDMSWDEKIPRWNVADLPPADDKMAAEDQLKQARGFAQGAYRCARRADIRTERMEAALRALAAGLGPEVRAAVEEALEDAVIDVNVNVSGGSDG